MFSRILVTYFFISTSRKPIRFSHVYNFSFVFYFFLRKPPASDKFKNRTAQVQQTHETETPRPLLPNPDLRAGAPLQAPKVPVGPRARANGPGLEADADTSEDLVPKSPVQEQEAEDREGQSGEGENGHGSAICERCRVRGALRAGVLWTARWRGAFCCGWQQRKWNSIQRILLQLNYYYYYYLVKYM